MLRLEFSKAVKEAALLRSKYRCELCEQRDELEFHHLMRSDNSLFSCQVLCRTCHAKIHVK